MNARTGKQATNHTKRRQLRLAPGKKWELSRRTCHVIGRTAYHPRRMQRGA